MSASCGPTFRNNVAKPAMAKRIASTSSPATTGTERPNIKTSFSTLLRTVPIVHQSEKFSGRSTREVFPLLHVGDSVLVAGDRDFRAIRKRLAILAPCSQSLTHAALLESHFPGAILTNGRADRAHRSFDPVIPIEHLGVAHFHNARHELEHHTRGKQSREDGDAQRDDRHQPRMS